MAVVQDAYASRQPALALGMVVNQELHNAVTRTLEDATAVGFGVALFKGTADDGVTATPSANFEGITIRDVTAEGATADTFEQGASISLLNHGVIAVQASKAVAKGAAVYVTSAGAFTDTEGTNTEIVGATFDSTTSAAGLVKLRVK